MEHPPSRQQTDSAQAEPRQEARLPRSPRYPHRAGSRRFPGQNMSPACRADRLLAGFDPTGLLLWTDLNDGI